MGVIGHLFTAMQLKRRIDSDLIQRIDSRFVNYEPITARKDKKETVKMQLCTVQFSRRVIFTDCVDTNYFFNINLNIFLVVFYKKL